MEELKWIAVVLILTTALAIVAVYVIQNVILTIPHGDAIEEYRAVYNPSQGELIEEHIFYISSSRKYRMLYRTWEIPLSVKEGESPVRVIAISHPKGSIAYVKDSNGRLHIIDSNVPTNIVKEIYKLAERNEVGCYFPDRIPAGTYKLRIEYEFRPPADYDGKYYHLNIKFANIHIPYKRFDIKILIPSKDIRLVYVHVPIYNIERGEDYIRIYGYSLKNMLISVELLFEENSSNDYKFDIRPTNGDLIKMMKSANFIYLLTYNMVRTLSYLALGINVAFPLITLMLYLMKGKEKEFVVPKYLSYVPNRKRKPWEVNLLFKGDALTMDENAFYATLLDLKRRGAIDIKITDDDVIVKIIRGDFNLDFYERKVLTFIEKWGRNGVLSFKELHRLAKRERLTRVRELANELEEILNTPSKAKKYAEKYLEKGVRNAFIALAFLSFILLIIMIALNSGPFGERYAPFGKTIGFSLAILLGQSVICAIPPSQIFGRWKKSFYKEKLEWDAFRNVLEDFAMIQKYAPEDLVIWKEWLVYGTALGVGENVVKAMRKLNIELPEAPLVIMTPSMVRSTYGTIVSRGATKGGKSFGGGFGPGGGFGGGGGGVR